MILLQVMSQETCYEVSSWQEPWKWRGCREVQRGSCDCQINCDKQSNINITRIYNHSCRRPMQYCRTQTKSDSMTCTGRETEGLLSWAPSMLMSLALLAGEQNYYSNYYTSIENISFVQAVWCPHQQSRHTCPHRDYPESPDSSSGIYNELLTCWCITIVFQHLGAGKTKADVPGFDLPNVEDLLWGQVRLGSVS